MNIDHLYGSEFLQSAARGQSAGQGVQAALQRDLHAVREERDEDVSLDAALALMEDRTYRQVLLQNLERLFHRLRIARFLVTRSALSA